MNRLPGSELTLPHDVDDRAAEGVWGTELDRLELEVLWAERLLRVTQPLEREGWTPRDDMPPLPPALAERARALLARQEETRLRLLEAMREIARDRVQGAGYDPRPDHTAERPRYVDLVG